MRRVLLVVSVAALMAVMLVVMTTPALAQDNRRKRAKSFPVQPCEQSLKHPGHGPQLTAGSCSVSVEPARP